MTIASLLAAGINIPLDSFASVTRVDADADPNFDDADYFDAALGHASVRGSTILAEADVPMGMMSAKALIRAFSELDLSTPRIEKLELDPAAVSGDSPPAACGAAGGGSAIRQEISFFVVGRILADVDNRTCGKSLALSVAAALPSVFPSGGPLTEPVSWKYLFGLPSLRDASMFH